MKTRLFDTAVQQLKYEVIKELIKAYDKGLNNEIYHDIPIRIMPGPEASLRCCVYKERAILQERLKLAMGGNKDNPTLSRLSTLRATSAP